MNPKRKYNDFGNFRIDFEELRFMAEQIANELIYKMQKNPHSKEPLVLGISINFDEKGNINMAKDYSPQKIIPKKSILTIEPLFETFCQGENLTITAELRGIEKNQIKVKAYRQKVFITLLGTKPFTKEIQLKERIIPNSGKATFTNNILELNFKAEPQETEKEIKVE